MSTTPPAPATVYSGATTNWPALVITAALAVPLVALGSASDQPFTDPAFLIPALVIVLLVGANIVMSSSLRVTIGPGGVRVRFGVFGWPRLHVAPERIARAEATEIPFWSSTGGICWTRRDGLRLTLRTGPALRLTLKSGRRITVNVEDPTAAITALDLAMASR